MNRSVFASALAGAAILLPAVPAAAQRVVGVSAAVRNDVRNRKVGTPVPRPVQVKDRIALNDQVQTGVKSQLQVLLLDKSVFTVGANARLTVDRYVYDPNRGSRSIGATVAKGAFRFMSGKPDRGGGSQIRTPVATIGIRGTILEGVVGESAALIAAGESAVGRNVDSDPDTASLIVLRGPGRATQGGAVPGSITVAAGGRTVAVDRPLLAVYVPGPGRAPIGPFRISAAGLLQIQALLYPSVAERLGWRGPADNLGTADGGTYFPPPRQGAAYPEFPGYPPGVYPPGSYPGGSGPGAGVPGFPSTNVPGLPRDGRQRTRGTPNTRVAPQGNQNTRSAPTTTQSPTPTPTQTPTQAPTPTPTPAPTQTPTSQPPPTVDPPTGGPNSIQQQPSTSPTPSPSPRPSPTPPPNTNLKAGPG